MASSRRPQDTLFSQRQNRRLAGNQPKTPAVIRPERGDDERKEKKRVSVADIKFPENYDWTRETGQGNDESDTAVPEEYIRVRNFYEETKPAPLPSPSKFPHAPTDFMASPSPPELAASLSIQPRRDTSPPPELAASPSPPPRGDTFPPSDGRIAKRIGNDSENNSDDEEDHCDNKNTANAKKQRKSSGGSSSSGREYERDPATLQRRQKQIDFGKNTIGYDNYIKLIPKNMRSREDPKTPIKHLKYSRRSWDALILIWRKALHNYDTPDSVKMEADTNQDKQ